MKKGPAIVFGDFFRFDPVVASWLIPLGPAYAFIWVMCRPISNWLLTAPGTDHTTGAFLVRNAYTIGFAVIPLFIAGALVSTTFLAHQLLNRRWPFVPPEGQ